MSENTDRPGVWPCLRYRDPEAARRFLTEVLGFVETATFRDADGRIEHAELRWPEGGGVMYGPLSEESAAVSTVETYVCTAGPDAVHRRAVVAGARIVRELVDTDYGSRDVSVADPEGNVWAFGTYRGA
ncbi:MAG TPA: VOC family protein [Thermobifida alba]|nr:VOC family protein [Thermobifida alba]